MLLHNNIAHFVSLASKIKRLNVQNSKPQLVLIISTHELDLLSKSVRKSCFKILRSSLQVYLCCIFRQHISVLSYSLFQLHFSYIHIQLGVDLAPSWTKVQCALTVLELCANVGSKVPSVGHPFQSSRHIHASIPLDESSNWTHLGLYFNVNYVLKLSILSKYLMKTLEFQVFEVLA